MTLGLAGVLLGIRILHGQLRAILGEIGDWENAVRGADRR